MDEAEVLLIGPDKALMLARVRPGTFDYDILAEELAAYLANPDNLLAVARVDQEIVAFASGTIIRHPDKLPSLFVNEVSCHEDFRGQKLGQAVSRLLMEEGARQGAAGTWVATEEDNASARSLYAGLGAKVTKGIVIYSWE